MPHRIAKQIFTQIERARHIVLIPHQNPDGDALGAVTSLMHVLRRMDKPHTVFCATDFSKKMNYLPGIDHLKTDPAIWNQSDIDLIIVMDSGDLGYAGVDHHINELNPKPMIINIDHHPTNEYFGDINMVIPEASSTCEIMYKLYRANDIEIDAHMATCLLTGLITDTGNFTNAATTTHALQIASDLMHRGGKMEMIKDIVMRDTSVSALKLWGTVLSRLAHHDNHEIVYTYLTQQDLKDHHVDDSESEGIANFMNAISEGKAALILKELPEGRVKGSFRTTRDDVDVSAIAKSLGGGGHKKAAGFTIDTDILQGFEKIWETMDKLSAE